MYTIRQLIDANRRALADRTLGAFRWTQGSYSYPDGCKCAIGVILPDDVLTRLNELDLNNTLIHELTKKKVIEVENVGVFRMTQIFHDIWAQRHRFYVGEMFVSGMVIYDLTMEMKEFIVRFNGQHIVQKNFADWIDLLDRTYPETAQ